MSALASLSWSEAATYGRGIRLPRHGDCAPLRVTCRCFVEGILRVDVWATRCATVSLGRPSEKQGRRRSLLTDVGTAHIDDLLGLRISNLPRRSSLRTTPASQNLNPTSLRQDGCCGRRTLLHCSSAVILPPAGKSKYVLAAGGWSIAPWNHHPTPLVPGPNACCWRGMIGLDVSVHLSLTPFPPSQKPYICR